MEYWLADEKDLNRIQEMADKYERLHKIALVSDEIAIVFREKAGKQGGKVILGKTSKTSPMQTALADKPWKFIIQIGHDEWVKLDGTQKTALLFHHLCGCGIEEDAEAGGDLKFSIIPPDYVAYREELEIFGVWRPETETNTSKGPVETLFGVGDGEDSEEEKDTPEE